MRGLHFRRSGSEESGSSEEGSVVSHGTDRPDSSGSISSCCGLVEEGTQRADGKRFSEITNYNCIWKKHLSDRHILWVEQDKMSCSPLFGNTDFRSDLKSVAGK